MEPNPEYRVRWTYTLLTGLWPDIFFSHMVVKTKRYCSKHSLGNESRKNFKCYAVTEIKMNKFLAMLLITGYDSKP
jgi:hypothetical protein